MKDRICISFSGGETSAFMAKILLHMRSSRDVQVVFANTGQEDEKTLTFVDRCDREWGLKVVWVEAAVSPNRGEGTRHKVVDFNTASRNGEPFRAVVAKYGLPGPGYTHCNRELKLAPITSYLRSIGWAANTYSTAIGIRADEIDRMSNLAKVKFGAVYPLVGLGVRKKDVQAFFDANTFRLGLPEHFGNCVWCWKKSLRKHLTIIQQKPDVFDFPIDLENEFENHSLSGPLSAPRRMFRGRLTAKDLKELAQKPFNEFFDSRLAPLELDAQGACGESCEVFADIDDFEEKAGDQ